MHKSYEINNYTLANFDQHFSLRPPPLLWAAMLFLSRAIALPLVIAAMSLIGPGGDLKAITQGLIAVHTLLPSALAFAVLCALFRRSPRGSRLTRWVWGSGRVLLAGAAILDLALGLYGIVYESALDGTQGAFVLLTAVFDLMLFAYIVASRRVRDVFADFPVSVN